MQEPEVQKVLKGILHPEEKELRNTIIKNANKTTRKIDKLRKNSKKVQLIQHIMKFTR